MSSSTGTRAARESADTWKPTLELATREVFELMLGCELTLQNGPPEPLSEIIAMVGLAGQLCGLLSLRCSLAAAALMASKMLDLELDPVAAEVFDAFGEVGNMVAGNFKNKIPGLSDGCMLSVPTVVTGQDYSVHASVETPPLELHMLFENLPVVVSLQISE